MIHFSKIRKLFILSVLMLIMMNSQGQFASGVAEYLPAPGQYTNADFIGTPAAAKSLIGTNRGLVSLGAFGGSITLEFSSGIKNDPQNPYGVDFTIFGNPTETWSEPGIVQVMKDENKNGLPDDTWYEIAGSDHYWNSTILGYEITYQNNGINSAADIQWTDNQEESGVIPENSFHRQSYYPQPELFPMVSTDKYTLKGTRLQGQIDLSMPGVVNSYRRAFGYADNTPVISFTEKLPDNPYTEAIEGSGGDAIDIDWAVDNHSQHVKLDEINFIRITTGMNALAGWLGEISTEITGIRDVEPASVNGLRSMVVIQDLPPKIGVGAAVDINALIFESGIKVENTPINWSVSNPDLAMVEFGQLKALKSGIVRLRASSVTNSSIYAEKELEIFSAGKAVINLTSNNLKINDKLELNGKFTDQSGKILTGITSQWRSENQAIAEVVQVDGIFYLKGKQTGKCWLYLQATEINSLRDSVQIQVLPESALKKVFISVKTTEKTLVPRHSIWVETTDLTSKVDENIKTYHLTDTTYISLAHVVAALYKNTDLENEWAFRDDAEGGSDLYLWRVPEVDEGSVVYYFGYGGSRTSEAHRKIWIVMLNQQPYVTGLDKIKVNNNDEILIYQVVDNEIPWSVTHLTSSSDSLKVNQNIVIQLMKYFCLMNQDQTVSVNSSDVLAYQTVLIEPQNSTKSGGNYTTDEFGKLALTFDKAGNYLFVSGIDVAKLYVSSTTGNQTSIENGFSCKVYPNPFTNQLRIECLSQVQLVQIVDIQGKIVYSEPYSQAEIPLKFLSSGFYILKVKTGNRIFQQKLIKQ